MFTQTVGFLLSLFFLSTSSLPVLKALYFSMKSTLSFLLSFMFSIEFSILILTENFQTTWYFSVWSNALMLELTHQPGLSIFSRRGNFYTDSSLYLSKRVAPWHYPTEQQALLIAPGLSGVSAWLFSPDIIIARVETVTRGWTETGRGGVSYP